MREHDKSYVLRVWKDGKSEEAWRASLKMLNAPEQKLFKSLDDLLSFLKTTDAPEPCEAEA